MFEGHFSCRNHLSTNTLVTYYAPDLRREGPLSVDGHRLSVRPVPRPKSRTERPRKPIFGTNNTRHRTASLRVEFYLYPTVSTALIYLLKPELNKWDLIEYGVRSNWVILRCMATIRRIVAYKVFINKWVKHTNVNNNTVYILQYSSI